MAAVHSDGLVQKLIAHLTAGAAATELFSCPVCALFHLFSYSLTDNQYMSLAQETLNEGRVAERHFVFRSRRPYPLPKQIIPRRQTDLFRNRGGQSSVAPFAIDSSRLG